MRAIGWARRACAWTCAYRDDAKAVVRAHEKLAGAGATASPVSIIVSPSGECRRGRGADVAGTHQIGTVRMGANRNEGVVDRDLAASTPPTLCGEFRRFPTSGQANPTLSIVAFAARLAERLARERAGESENKEGTGHAQ